MAKNKKPFAKITKPVEPAPKQKSVTKGRLKSLQLLTIFFFAFLLYGNTIGFDYALDDAIVVTDNKFTKEGTKGIKDLLTKDTFFGFFGENKQLVSGGRYRPLSLVTLAVEVQCFGINPHISHFINIVLYGLTGILLFLLLGLFFNGPPAILSVPFVTTLLFMAHPLHTEVVANIKGRDEILCFLLVILSMFTLFKYLKTDKTYLLLISVPVYFLACMTKENAITFLAVIPLSMYFFSNRTIKQITIQMIPYLIAAGVFWFLRGHFTKSSVDMEVKEVLNNPFVYMTGAQKYATILFTWLKYLLLLVFPHPLTHDYYYNQIPAKNWNEISVVLSTLLHIGMFVYAMVKLKSKSIVSYGILFYLLTFSVVSNFFFPIGTTMSERFVYISSFGLILIVSKFIVDYSSKLRHTKIVYIFLGLVLAGYSFKTITRNEVWRNNYTLFTTDVKTSPNSAKLRNSAGGETMAESDKETDPAKKRALLETSIAHLKKALDIYPDYTIAWLLLGNAYFKYDNSYQKAIDCYQQIVRINPNYPDAYYNLGVTYKTMGDLPNAKKNYLKLLSYRSTDVNAYYTLGQVYKELNVPDSAIGFLYKIIELKPETPGIYREIGTIYGQNKGNFDQAIAFLKKAVEQDPKDESAWENLGIAYGFKKDINNAVVAFNKALELSPNNANVYKNLAVSYHQLGNLEKANEYYAKANALMKK